MTKLDFIASRVSTKDFVFIITYLDNYAAKSVLAGLLESKEVVDPDADLSSIITRLCSFALGSDEDLKKWLSIYQHSLITEGLTPLMANHVTRNMYEVLTA